MDPIQTDPREYQRQAIEAKINSFEESIRVLRSHRNTLAPISSLPTEVINGIFSYLRVPGTFLPFTLGEEHGKKDPLAWLRVAHVCHHWREIALNQPVFWSYVNFTNVSSAGAAEILTRAKIAPLYLEASDLRGNWNDIQFVEITKELQRRLSHIRYLGMSGIHTRLYETLQALESPAPTLEHRSPSFNVYHATTSPLPDALFDGITPRLSRLELHNGDINWKSPLLKRLTYLDIRSLAWNARPGLAVWLDSLKEMSQLKTLILHSASPVALCADTSLPFGVERTTTLPFLTHLDISASPRDCALALAHLDLPVLAHLSISTKARRDSELQKILPYIALHAHGPQDTQPLQSMLIYTSSMRVDILAWTAPDIDFDVRGSSVMLDAILSARMFLSVVTKEMSSSDTHTRIFDEVMAALPLDSLVTLTAPDYALHDWRRHAPRWCLLQRVRLGFPAANALRKILLDDNGEHKCSLLPSLKILILVDTELRGPWILDLCDTLMKRVDKGVPLEVVDFRTCAVTDHKALQQLIKIVVVAWDPSEEFYLTGKSYFTTCYSGARSLLVQGNSEPDSDVDEDSK